MGKRGKGKKPKKGETPVSIPLPSPRGLAVLAAGALMLLCAWTYKGSLQHPLLHDDRTLLDNAWMANEASVATVFRHHYWHGSRHEVSDLYRPVTILTLAWNLENAPSRSGFRAVNTLFHCAVTLLAWWALALVLERFADDRDRSPIPGFDRGPPRYQVAAWIAATLLAVHPVASEAVLFATGRAELLAAGFGLAAFALLAGARETSRVWWPRVAGSAVLFWLALCSKESAASWLVILAAWYACLRLTGREPGRLLHGAVGWPVALVAFVVLRGRVVGWLPLAPPWIDNPLVLEGPVTRVANALVLHAHYLGKMVFPYRLTVEYGFDQTPVLSLFPWGALAALAVVAVWAGVAYGLGRLSTAALFLWCWIPAAFAVTGNLVFPIGTIFAERLAYLPLIGFCGLVAYRISHQEAKRGVVLGLLVFLLVVCFWRTSHRIEELSDHTTFVEATAADSPRSVKALVNVGRSRLRRGMPAEAVEPLERAVEIWPDYARARRLLEDARGALENKRPAP